MVTVTATGNTHTGTKCPSSMSWRLSHNSLERWAVPAPPFHRRGNRHREQLCISAEGTPGAGSNVPALSTHMAAINTAAARFPGKLLQPPEKRLYSADVLVWWQLSQNLPDPFLQDRGIPATHGLLPPLPSMFLSPPFLLWSHFLLGLPAADHVLTGSFTLRITLCGNYLLCLRE